MCSSMFSPPQSTRPAAPPARLLWHERVCTTASQGLQLRIPFVGRSSEDLAARISRDLDGLWTGRPSADGGAVTSVAAVVGRAGGFDSLIVFLSFDRMPDGRRMDDSRMARELQAALDRCTALPA